ncbi:hypothetical protein Tco_0830794 [Tanacetum coccineum]
MAGNCGGGDNWRLGSFWEYNSLFFRHVLPCKVNWGDLVSVVDVDDEGDGSEFDTYLSGFKISGTIRRIFLVDTAYWSSE